MTDAARTDRLLEGILHPGEVDRFVSGARPTAVDELAALADRVVAHAAGVAALARHRPVVDGETAQRIAAVLVELLGGADRLADDQRALLRGAVEYFVLDDDEVDDTSDVVGFDDDARVVNAVTAALGRPDLRVEVA